MLKGDTSENLIGLLEEDLMQLFIEQSLQLQFFQQDS